MTKTDFVKIVRFIFCDSATSNFIQRESITARPGNIIDGVNTLFLLQNRRLVSLKIYDATNTVVSPLLYTADLAEGKVIFTAPPTDKLWTDYYWQKLTDDEIDEAIFMAQATGQFDVNMLNATLVDYATYYVVAYCFAAAANRAADYYTMSAGGKQVSKSELFNHYQAQHDKFLTKANDLRTDQRTERGNRAIPGDAESTPDCVSPYFPNNNGGGM